MHTLVQTFARHARRALITFLLGGLAAPAAAEDWWSNTVTAYQAAPGISLGPVASALALVLALVLVVAWAAKRLGWTPGAAPAAGAEERVLCYARFNRRQSLAVVEREERLECLIFEGRALELRLEIPSPPGRNIAKRRHAASPTFAEWWRAFTRPGKGGA